MPAKIRIGGIILGRTLQGAGAIASTVMALVADLTREEQRTKAMAVVGMSIGLSFAVAIVLGPAVAAMGSLSAVFWFTAVLAVIGIVIVTVLVPSAPVVSERLVAGANMGVLRRSLENRVLLRLNFGVFVLHFILTASFLLVPGLLEQSFGVDREQHWKVYLPVLLLSLAGMVPLMVLAERGGRLRMAFLVASHWYLRRSLYWDMPRRRCCFTWVCACFLWVSIILRRRFHHW